MARSKNAELDEQLDKQPLDAARVADLRSGLKLDAALCDGLASASAVSAILARLKGRGSSRCEEASTSSVRGYGEPR
jgi:hypothetical protein